MRNWIGMSVFALAAITDWFDGYLARRWGETSAFGAFLDPVADKLMVAAALILLVELGRAEVVAGIRAAWQRARRQRRGSTVIAETGDRSVHRDRKQAFFRACRKLCPQPTFGQRGR